jgi:hypothetical protein
MFRSNLDLARDRVTVRHAHLGDEAELGRLAALDSARPPVGPTLVAESDARILAALPTGSGRPIADPFEPTAELVALLELRKGQLERGDRSRRRLIERVRTLLRAPVAETRL